MNNLKRKFDRLYAKFQRNKDRFKKVIDRWRQKGFIEESRKWEQELEELELLSRDLQSNFLVTAEGSYDDAVLHDKLRKFKTSYKELAEVTKPEWQQWLEAIVIALLLAACLRNFIFGLYHVPTGSAEPNILVGDRLWGNKMIYHFSKPQRGDLVIFDNPEFPYERSGSIGYYWQQYIGLGIPLLGLPSGADSWVKRVIAVPGDVVEGRIEEGRPVVYLNGKKLPEPYVNPYPLITLHKTTCFVNLKHVGPLGIPSFLRKITKPVHYTYVPTKSFAAQPFYSFTDDDVIYKENGHEPLLIYPHEPTMTYVTDVEYHRFSYCVDEFGPVTVPEGKYWVMGDSRKNSRDSRFWQFLDEKLIHGRASFVIWSLDSEEAFWLFDLIKHPIDFFTKHLRLGRCFKNLSQFNGRQDLADEKK